MVGLSSTTTTTTILLLLSLKKQNKPYIYSNEEEGMEGEKNISTTQKNTQNTVFAHQNGKSPEKVYIEGFQNSGQKLCFVCFLCCEPITLHL